MSNDLQVIILSNVCGSSQMFLESLYIWEIQNSTSMMLAAFPSK